MPLAFSNSTNLNPQNAVNVQVQTFLNTLFCIIFVSNSLYPFIYNVAKCIHEPYTKSGSCIFHPQQVCIYNLKKNNYKRIQLIFIERLKD